jgi:hypothetical protein
MLQLFHLGVSKVDRGCCACYNMSHLRSRLLQLLGRHAWREAVREVGKHGGVALAGPAYAAAGTGAGVVAGAGF